MEQTFRIRNTLREHREARGMTLRTLADAIGVHYSLLGHVEQGRSYLGDDAKLRVAAVLGVSVADLFFPDYVERVENCSTPETETAGCAA